MEGFLIKNDKLENWGGLLCEWLAILREYRDNWDGDEFAYYYGENTNVGLLAQAATSLEWDALVERNIKGRNGKTKTKSGFNVDLWLASGEENEMFFVEAKLIRSIDEKPQSPWTKEKFIKEVKKKLDEACEDAIRIIPYKDENDIHRIGICFLVAKFRKNDKKVTSQIKKFIIWARNRDIKTHALAWFFPKKAKEVGEEKFFEAGIIMLVRYADKEQEEKRL